MRPDLARDQLHMPVQIRENRSNRDFWNFRGVCRHDCDLYTDSTGYLCSQVPVSYGQAAGAELTISGFTATYGNWVSVFTAVAMCCFAFSTIIGWGLYGTRCIEFLFGSRVNKPFMLVYALVAIVGATMDLGLMWSIAETFNGLMAIPNLTAVFLLSGVVVKLVKEYFVGEGAKS